MRVAINNIDKDIKLTLNKNLLQGGEQYLVDTLTTEVYNNSL